jgi:hypothetical protein
MLCTMSWRTEQPEHLGSEGTPQGGAEPQSGEEAP